MLKDLPCGDGAWLSEAECAAFDLGSFYGFVRVDVEVEKRNPWWPLGGGGLGEGGGGGGGDGGGGDGDGGWAWWWRAI